MMQLEVSLEYRPSHDSPSCHNRSRHVRRSPCQGGHNNSNNNKNSGAVEFRRLWLLLLLLLFVFAASDKCCHGAFVEEQEEEDDGDDDDDDYDDDEDVGHLRRSREQQDPQQQACRRNPSWTMDYVDNDDNNDNSSNSSEGIVVVDYETCTQAWKAFPWMTNKSPHEMLHQLWASTPTALLTTATTNNNYSNIYYEDYDEDNVTEILEKPNHSHYWIHWWHQENRHVEFQTCLRNKASSSTTTTAATTKTTASFKTENSNNKPANATSTNRTTTVTPHTTIAMACSSSYSNSKHGEDDDDEAEENENPEDPLFMRPLSHYSQVGDNGDLVTIENVLTDCEAAWLESFVSCMHEQLPLEMPFFQERPFGDESTADANVYGLYNSGGGNYVTFLAGLLQKYLPGVVHSLYHAMTAAYHVAEWGHYRSSSHHPTTIGQKWPHPMTLGLRTAEYLKYQTSGRLGLHGDFESVYTISVALSNPTDYDGGYFTMKHSSVLFKLPRRSAVVFRSEDVHGITPLTSGERRVFVVEFWPLDHVPLGFSRPAAEDFETYMSWRYGKDAQEEEEEEDDEPLHNVKDKAADVIQADAEGEEL